MDFIPAESSAPDNYHMYFPIPEGSAFDQQTRTRGKVHDNPTSPRRGVGLFIAGAGLNWPLPADPALTGLSRQGFPFHPISIGAWTTFNPNIGISLVNVTDNTGYLVPGPPRVIWVRYVFNGLGGSNMGRPNAMWIFYTFTGPYPFPSEMGWVGT
jgi:hypothetical protein